MTRFLLFAFLLLAAPWLRAADDELLEPEVAFRFSAEMVKPDLIQAQFRVAKGYYLYKNKIKFSAQGAKLGKPELPPGKSKKDEIFGQVDVYLSDFRVRIPVSGATKPFTLKASFQGCAEVGVCYPPQEASIELQPPAPEKKAAKDDKPTTSQTKPEAKPEIKSETRPATTLQSLTAAPAASAAPAGDQNQSPELIARLKQLAGADTMQSEPEFLPPEEAFKVAVTIDKDGNLQANYSIAAEHYLYRDKLKLNVSAPPGVQVEALQLPKADEKDDPNFGKMFVYHDSFTASSRLIGLPPGTQQVILETSMQGCSEKGICYPPMTRP